MGSRRIYGTDGALTNHGWWGGQEGCLGRKTAQPASGGPQGRGGSGDRPAPVSMSMGGSAGKQHIRLESPNTVTAETAIAPGGGGGKVMGGKLKNEHAGCGALV